ncbi:MAG: copper homeostasis protein CutC [Chitinophagaceae bacterium]|nr:MAG: copper homeostasis protein CutC [Chitinophagaceae bacterium]
MSFKLELIAFNIQSCIDAQAAGAQRVELCANPAEGGTTPSYGFIKAARDKLTIDLYPIIRPRGGDFVYTDDEFEIMKSEIKVCKVFGCNGIVVGMLHADGSVDKLRCKELIDLAKPLGVTFHRAFDRSRDLLQALEDVIEIGCERILTSGGFPTAVDGSAMIAELIKHARGRIVIMPGSGVRSGNIKKLAQETGAVEFHSSARMNLPGKMNFISHQMKEDQTHVSIDVEEATALALALNE